MMTPTDTDPLALALADSWRTGTPLDATTACALAPPDVATAFQVQKQTGELLGWFADGRPRAWKVGAGSRTAQPTSAPITAEHLHTTGSAAFQFAASRAHTMIGVEFELAVEFAHDLSSTADAQDVRAAIGRVHTTIEICDIRATGEDLPATFYLADLQNNHCLIIGETREGSWRDSDANSEVSVWLNGEVIKHQFGGHPLGDPLYLLPWLNRHAQALYGSPLRAGDIVTAGTWTGLHKAQRGDRMHARYTAVGGIAIDIV